MKAADQRSRLKLALEALERPVPNLDLARGLLRDVVGEADRRTTEDRHHGPAPVRGSVGSVKQAAVALGYGPHQIRKLARSGVIPSIGSGRSLRILIDEAIEALRQRPSTNAEVIDPMEEAAAAWASGRRGEVVQ